MKWGCARCALMRASRDSRVESIDTFFDDEDGQRKSTRWHHDHNACEVIRSNAGGRTKWRLGWYQLMTGPTFIGRPPAKGIGRPVRVIEEFRMAPRQHLRLCFVHASRLYFPCTFHATRVDNLHALAILPAAIFLLFPFASLHPHSRCSDSEVCVSIYSQHESGRQTTPGHEWRGCSDRR